MSDEILPPIQPEEANPAPQEPKPQDDLSDLRASMAVEEQERLKAKKSGLLKKVTGLLHRQTGTLAESEPAASMESRPSGPFTAPLQPDEDLSNEIFEQQVGRSFSGWDEEEPAAEVVVSETPELAETRPLIWDDAEEAAELVQAAATEARPAFPDEDLEAVAAEAPASQTPAFDEPLESLNEVMETPPGEAENAAPTESMPEATGSAFVLDEEGETWEEPPAPSETESLRAELIPDAAPESIPVEPPRKKTTRSLRQVVTGWLNPDAVKEEAHEDVADEMIVDRLQRVQSNEYPPEIPGARKFTDTLSTPADEGMAGAEDDLSGEAALWKPRVERGQPQPRPDDQSGWGRGSRLPRDWVDEHAAYPAQEPVAAEYGAAPEEPPIQKAPSRLSEVVQQGSEETGPAIEDVRSQALEDYVEPEYVAVEMQTPREPFPQRALAWARKNFALLLTLGIVVVLVSLLAATRPWTRAPIAQPNTPVPSELPYPVGMELTGGWFFDVNRSTMINGVWQPQSAEWLDNSQMRRVVAIPWNEQTEAVIQTLDRGDQINLVFSNNDLMAFLVRSVERLDKSDTALMTENKPGLVIILYNEDSDQRWVVLALPK